jgi:Fe-S cluster assembly iron-binding protein IscA
MNVTVRAADVLHQALDEEQADESRALRVTLAEEGGYRLGVDDEREGDDVIEHDGRKILLMEPAVARALDEVTLDVVAADGGTQLALYAPRGSEDGRN